ncbi:MAG: hypothetical protein M0Z39_02675 [Actinomycetota bacterium]|nr:hypothetical protein [Actinomycetota bacterium]
MAFKKCRSLRTAGSNEWQVSYCRSSATRTIALVREIVVVVVGSLGAPLITSAATTFRVSVSSALWTLTMPLLTGAIATPMLGSLGAGLHRRGIVVGTLFVIASGSLLTALPFSSTWLGIGRGVQGIGLGLPALMMGVARDHVSPLRALSTI